MTATGFGLGSRPFYLDRAVYTTITIMSVLIVYDGRSEQLNIIRTESRFLLLAGPALTLLAILTLAGVSLGISIQTVIFLEGASLGFWGFIAGRRAGLASWPLARTVVFGLIVGLLVLALQVFLQPGHASLTV